MNDTTNRTVTVTRRALNWNWSAAGGGLTLLSLLPVAVCVWVCVPVCMGVIQIETLEAHVVCVARQLRSSVCGCGCGARTHLWWWGREDAQCLTVMPYAATTTTIVTVTVTVKGLRRTRYVVVTASIIWLLRFIELQAQHFLWHAELALHLHLRRRSPPPPHTLLLLSIIPSLINSVTLTALLRSISLTHSLALSRANVWDSLFYC